MKYKKIPLKEFMRIYHIVPRAVVELTVVTKDGFILTKRSISPYKGMWHLPGGTILFKEPIKHAIDRVAREELGVKLKSTVLLGVVENLDEGGRHVVCCEYLAKVKSGRIRGSKQAEEVKAFKNIPKNIIPEQGKFLKENMKEISNFLEEMK